MKTFGIIGHGNFGRFLENTLKDKFEIKVFDSSLADNPGDSTLEEVAKCNVIALAVPLSAYKETCKSIKPYLAPDTIIVDLCSVKVASSKIVHEVLPEQPVLTCHPLFGPESASESLTGHVIVICPDRTSLGVLNNAKIFCSQLGLDVVEMDTEEHDREMSLVHGLTFFIARTLKDFDLHDSKLATPSFKKLVALAELEKHHSKDLFITIQKGNPYADEVRQHFIDRAQTLQDLLAKEPKTQ